MARHLATLTLLLVFAATSSGCGYRTVWSHPAKSSEEFLKDDYDCRVEAAPKAQVNLAIQMERDCLQLRGWKPVREPRSLTAWWQRITN